MNNNEKKYISGAQRDQIADDLDRISVDMARLQDQLDDQPWNARMIRAYEELKYAIQYVGSVRSRLKALDLRQFKSTVEDEG